ncbi:MAG TPA: hypothetical protein VFZ52_20240, partial [Chryseolinea sp.]
MRNILIVILLYSFTAHAVPSGHWLGILKIKPMTYRIFLKYDGAAGSVYILNPKSNEIPLETLYFRNDSLFFKRSDFYSTFRGKYVPASNTIDGYWTDDGHK